MGLPVTRQDIINWQTKSTEYYFELLYQLLKEKLLEQKFLHADETTYRVLESETVKTFYWTFLSDKQAKKTITLYHHDPHRSGQLAQATLVGCWAHVRRKFFEAVPPEASNKSISNQGVRY